VLLHAGCPDQTHTCYEVQVMAEEQSTVTFRDVPGFPGYRVGDDGSVWYCWITCRQGRRMTSCWKPMKLAVHARGYLTVNLTPPSGGKYQTFRVHRLVLEAFVGPCPEDMECRHLNGVRRDCRLVNLAWGTRAENIDDKRRHANYGPHIRLYTHDGRTLPLKDWAREFKIPYTCLWHRVNKLGMSFEEAISRPYHGTASNGGHWTAAKRAKAP
jgi:hypothetical protein